ARAVDIRDEHDDVASIACGRSAPGANQAGADHSDAHGYTTSFTGRIDAGSSRRNVKRGERDSSLPRPAQLRQGSWTALMSLPVRPSASVDARKTDRSAATVGDVKPPDARSALTSAPSSPAPSPAARISSCIRVSTGPGAMAFTRIL